MANINEIKKLRQETSVGVADAKKALEETGGDFTKAKEWLRKKGLMKATEKASREAKEGFIGSYIHQTGKLGVLVAIHCETDFVARTDDFKNLAHDIAMHIAAFSPEYVAPEDIPEEEIQKMKEDFAKEVEGKPEKIQGQIIQGKLDKYYSEVCLLKQPFLKDDSITIEELLGEMVGKLGENIKIKKFAKMLI